MSKKRNSYKRYAIEYRREVIVTDEEALLEVALEHAKSAWLDPGDETGLKAQLEFIRSGPDAALVELFTDDDGLDLLPGIEVGLSDLTVEAFPHPNSYVGPSSKKHSDAKARRKHAVASILAWAPAVTGIDHFFINSDPDDEYVDERTPQEKERWEQQFILMKGLLWHSSQRVIAQLFDDVLTLATTDHVSESTIDDTHVLSELPERFAGFYDQGFAQKFTAAMIDVSQRFASGWRSLGTVAEELALHLILGDAEYIAQLWELDLPSGWRSDLTSVLYDVLDHEYLLDPRFAGFEEDPGFGPHGMAPMEFTSWFVVFNEGYFASPYAQDPAPTDPYQGQVAVSELPQTMIETDQHTAL